MTCLDASAEDILDAVLDAVKHDDVPAVRALTVALARVDREMTKRLVRSSDYRRFWEYHDWREMIDR